MTREADDGYVCEADLVDRLSYLARHVIRCESGGRVAMMVLDACTIATGDR